MDNKKTAVDILQEKLNYIIEHHAKMTTIEMAATLNEKPSWVETQIGLLRENNFIKNRKRPPRKNAIDVLKKLKSGSDVTKPDIPTTSDPEPVEKEPLSKKKISAAIKGVPDGWTRQTVVARIERFKNLEMIAWYTRMDHLREIYDDAFKEYIEKRLDILGKAQKEREKN